MDVGVGAGVSAGSVVVKTTSHRGFTPDEIVDRCMNKLMSIADTADPVIRQQARAFKSQMRQVILFYMKESIRSDRTTLVNQLEQQGHKDMADIIRRL